MKKLSEVANIRSVNSKKGLTEGAVFVQTVGEFTVVEKPDSFTSIIEVIPGKEVLKEYLYQIIQKPLREYNKLDKGTTFKRINAIEIENILIPVPPIERQQKLLKSKNIKNRFTKLWLEYEERANEEPLFVNMSFNELLKLMKSPKNNNP